MDSAVGSMAAQGQMHCTQIPGALSDDKEVAEQILESGAVQLYDHSPMLEVEEEAWQSRIPPVGDQEGLAIDEAWSRDG